MFCVGEVPQIVAHCVIAGYRGSCRRTKKTSQPAGEDATVLCSRLEKKIAGLSKLGGQLQHENKSRGRLSTINNYLHLFPIAEDVSCTVSVGFSVERS